MYSYPYIITMASCSSGHKNYLCYTPLQSRKMPLGIVRLGNMFKGRRPRETDLFGVTEAKKRWRLARRLSVLSRRERITVWGNGL